MVIQADGEKYACDACVRGHRVSSCTHKDRHLNHINRKGRPVSQCPHCRSLRKNRASHVKCVCVEAGLARPEGSGCHDSGTGACLCSQGQPCICAAKREAYATDHLSKVASLNTTSHRRTQSKPTIANRRSDSAIPKYQNGHHPPLHRFNHAAHDYSPYPVKRSQTTSGPINISQRSDDNLASGMPATASTDVYPASPSSLPMTSYMSSAGALGSGNALASASVPSGLNNFASEAQGFPGASRWSMTDFTNMSNYPGFGSEQYSGQDPMSALSDQQFNWADWDFNAASASEGTQLAGSVASVDHPGLSRSSSGTASDTGESSFNPADVSFPNMGMPSMASNEMAWALGDSWPNDGLDGSNLQDKTPLAMPSQSTGSATGLELNDYFGDFRQNSGTFNPASGQTAEAAVYASAPASVYEGSMSSMTMPTVPEQVAAGWSPAELMPHVKRESPAQGEAYRDQSWL